MRVKKIIKSLVPPKYWPNSLLELWLQRRFLARMGRRIDFNSPQSFNEKIQWYKIYYRNPIMSEIVDKIKFKKYVEERIGEGYTAELYDVWHKKEDIDLKKFTPPYVIKSNCSSCCKNIIFILDNDFDENIISKEIENWFRKTTPGISVNGDRYAYWNVKPAVLVEEYIPSNYIGQTDYKFFCLDGVPYGVLSIEGRFEGEKHMTEYDMDWNVIKVLDIGEQSYPSPRPKHFDKMVEIATTLSMGFPFVRVDFYDTAEGPLLGEMTFYPMGGYHHFNPENNDYELGQLFKIPNNN